MKWQIWGMTPSSNTRSYTLRSVPSSPGRSFLTKCHETGSFNEWKSVQLKVPRSVMSEIQLKLWNLMSRWCNFIETHIAKSARNITKVLFTIIFVITFSKENLRGRKLTFINLTCLCHSQNSWKASKFTLQQEFAKFIFRESFQREEDKMLVLPLRVCKN